MGMRMEEEGRRGARGRWREEEEEEQEEEDDSLRIISACGAALVAEHR